MVADTDCWEHKPSSPKRPDRSARAIRRLHRSKHAESEISLLFLPEFRPISARFLEQTESAVHIGAHKIIRPMNRAVHMAFRRKMHNRPRTASPQQVADQLSIADVSMHEAVARIGRNLYQVAEIPGIGELVEIHHRSSLGREPLQHEIGADKAGSPGH